MRKEIEWGAASYDILKNDKVLLEQRRAACFSQFMSGNFPQKDYNKIKIYDLDCEKTKEYKEFYLQYVIDMLNIKASFNEEYFEFKSTGSKYKDAAVMSIVRLIWEKFLNKTPIIDTPTLFFKRLRDDECEYKDKLQRFCYFYSKIPVHSTGYNHSAHSWLPGSCAIKSTKDFEECVHWTSVNGFFTT